MSASRSRVAERREQGALERLVAPTSPQVFASDHWGRAPHHVPGRPGKFDDVYNLDAWQRREGLRSVDGHLRNEQGLQTQFPIEPDRIDSFFARGLTICADVSAGPGVSSFLHRLCRELRIGEGEPFAKVYASPDGAGFAFHTDPQHVFVAQIAGKKQWRFSRRPVHPWALSGAKLDRSGLPVFSHPRSGEPVVLDDGSRAAAPTDGDLETVTLAPGDCLYLPPGTWHTARAIGTSVAVSLSPPRSSPLRAIFAGLEEALLARAACRRDVVVPPGVNGPPGRVPVDVAAAFQICLTELKDVLARTDESFFHRCWAAGVEAASARRSGPEPVGAPDETNFAVAPGDAFAHAGPGPLTYLLAPIEAAGEPCVVFHGHGAEFALARTTERFAGELCRHNNFRVRDAEGWDPELAAGDVRDLLARFLAARLIVRNV